MVGSVRVGPGGIVVMYDETAGEILPCISCGRSARLIAPPDGDAHWHQRCSAGHDHTLVPAVLEFLREHAAAERRPA